MSYIEQNPHNGSSLCMQWAAGKASRKALLYNAISDARNAQKRWLATLTEKTHFHSVPILCNCTFSSFSQRLVTLLDL